jgi:hypothetical protein
MDEFPGRPHQRFCIYRGGLHLSDGSAHRNFSPFAARRSCDTFFALLIFSVVKRLIGRGLCLVLCWWEVSCATATLSTSAMYELR